MDLGRITRHRYVVSLVALAVAVAVGATVWFMTRPAVTGDVAWAVPASELGAESADDVRGIEVAAESDAALALSVAGATRVVDRTSGETMVSLDVETPLLVRDDGSGLGVPVDLATEYREGLTVLVAGWDADGAETFAVTHGDLEDAAGLDAAEQRDSRLEHTGVIAFDSDTVVVGACLSERLPEQERTYATVVTGYDAATGRQSWRETLAGPGRGGCGPGSFATPVEGPELVLVAETADEGRQALMLETDTGRVVAGTPTDDLWTWEAGSDTVLVAEEGQLRGYDTVSGTDVFTQRVCSVEQGRARSVFVAGPIATVGCGGGAYDAFSATDGAAIELPDDAGLLERSSLYVTRTRDSVTVREVGSDDERWSRSVDLDDGWELHVETFDRAGLLAIEARAPEEEGEISPRRVVVVDAATGDEVTSVREAGQWWVEGYGDGEVLLVDGVDGTVRSVSP